ncbi:MAG: hypothetical protein LBV75_02515 [Paludibacter sp.]|jgi:hypothetical protein|nr:hypothetical protein [Paludibacter sp.]
MKNKIDNWKEKVFETADKYKENLEFHINIGQSENELSDFIDELQSIIRTNKSILSAIFPFVVKRKQKRNKNQAVLLEQSLTKCFAQVKEQQIFLEQVIGKDIEIYKHEPIIGESEECMEIVAIISESFDKMLNCNQKISLEIQSFLDVLHCFSCYDNLLVALNKLTLAQSADKVERQKQYNYIRMTWRLLFYRWKNMHN